MVLAGCGLPLLAAPAAGAPTVRLGTVVLRDPGPGYTRSAQGPLAPAAFASDAPDPAVTAGALSTLARSSPTYERVWQADGGGHRVQDLLVHFPDPTAARAFLLAARRALASGAVVSSDALPGLTDARRVTYLGATGHAGVGQAITLQAGPYVDLLSFFSATSGDAGPISPAAAEGVARAQDAALAAAPGGAPTTRSTGGRGKGVSAGTVGAAVLVVAVLALAVATPVLLRRRRGPAVRTPPGTSRRGLSGRDPVDDLGEDGG